MNSKETASFIVKWLQDYCTNAKCNGFVIGVSGGIDSAVTAKLCALTGLATTVVELPIHQHANQVSRAFNFIQNLKKDFPNVSRQIVELTATYDTLAQALPTNSASNLELSLANSRARLRMTVLYYFAGIEGKLVVGTGNKVEDFGVGFFTKYGDGGVDLSPIADITKTEVYELGRFLNIDQAILEAAPTDGLWGDNRTDEDQLGATYPEIEWAMSFTGTETNLTDREKTVLGIYRKLHAANRHKMLPIPICIIPENLKV